MKPVHWGDESHKSITGRQRQFRAPVEHDSFEQPVPATDATTNDAGTAFMLEMDTPLSMDLNATPGIDFSQKREESFPQYGLSATPLPFEWGNDYIGQPITDGIPRQPSQILPRLNLPQYRKDKRSGHHIHRPISLLPLGEESISLLNSMSMYGVTQGEEAGWQRQDIFINNILEDMAFHSTAKVTTPVPETLPLKESEAEERKVVASTASGAAIAGLGDFASAAIRYISNIAMTHMVSIATYGIFVEAYTVVTVGGYASKLGLDSALLRFLSTYRTKGERSYVAGLIRFTLTITLISGLICAGLFYLLSSFLAHTVYHKSVYELPFKEVALLVPLIGLQLVLASGLQAMKAIKWKVYVDKLIQPALTLILLVVFYFLGLRLEALILATTCGFLASAIVGYFLLHKATRNFTRASIPRYERKTWMHFALPMFFNSMIRNVLNSTDVLFLGAFATANFVGLYGAADRVSYFVVMPLIALNVIFSPIIAELHTKGQLEQLEKMFKIVTKWSFSLSLPIFLCCLLFHDAILGIFGAKYIEAGLVLIILAGGNLVDAGVGSVNYLLVMTGRPRVILINTVTTVIVNLSLVTVLVPRLGIVGAALSAALAVIILNIVGLIEVYFILGIHPYRWDIFKPVLAGAIASMAGIFLLQIVPVSPGYTGIVSALGLVIPFALVYISALYLLRFSEEDKLIFDTILSKFSKKKPVLKAQ